jgi:LmbE family N-acetylglucosaminyl deacetylase
LINEAIGFADGDAWIPLFGAPADVVPPPDPPEGFQAVFNGRDLGGWEGSPAFWSVEEGCLTGKADGTLKFNRFITWRGGTLRNFELRVKVKVSPNGNSGLQYRGTERPDLGETVVTGYQCDVVANRPDYNGMLYEERGRRILAHTGEKVVIDASGQPWVVGQFPLKSFAPDQWHDYRVIAEGNHQRHWIDSHATVDVIDLDEKGRKLEGVLAVQVHVGPPMTIKYRDFFLKVLPDNLPIIKPDQAIIPPGAHKVAPQGQDTARKPDSPLTVVVFGGHPDDPESGAGGLISMLTRAGHDVICAYGTTFRGDRRFFGRPEGEVRREEATAACSILGAKPKFFPFAHENLVADEATLKEIASWLAQVKPDIVVTHWPLDTHPNHHTVSSLVWQCYQRHGGWNLYFFEVMTDQQTIGFAPDHFLDIAPVRDVKKRSLDAHKSQNPDEIWQVHERMHRRRGKECGVDYAEAYKLVAAKEGCPTLPVSFLTRKISGRKDGLN